MPDGSAEPPPPDTDPGRLDGPGALTDYFARHRERLRAMVVFRLGNRLRGRVDPSDVLQETYLDAASRLAEYRANPRLPPFIWLRFLAAQRLNILFRRHLGAAARSVEREVPLGAAAGPSDSSSLLAEQLIAGGTPPPEQAARLELEAVVAAALDELEEADREILILRHFEHLTNTEAAGELGVSESAASKRYVRALLRLKEILVRFPGLAGEGSP
jgi:RNA polymerase sigma-70 factor, ECF subfamily